MATFTAAELQLINLALPLLKDKGPGWAIKTQDDYARWMADLSCLQSKISTLHEMQTRAEQADKIDVNGQYMIYNPAHPNHGEMVTIEHKKQDDKRTWFRCRTFGGEIIYNVRADELRG